ncbi:MAG TPA: RNA-binding transcriptional accessory protein [Clostridiaceae bacterium]|nr:RNA-binding transcriptional accessory protein [Clostridiaceae bacterium]
MDRIVARLIQEFKLQPYQVQNTIKLIDDGCTIPFIARYRKEMTGELNDQVLRELHERLIYLRNLEARKEDVKRMIEEAGKLTPEISDALSKAETLQEVEDIYLPFKPKRRTRASIAKEKGLEPLATIIFMQGKLEKSIEEVVRPFINKEKGVETVDDALNGAMDIIAEIISDNAEYRKAIREVFLKEGIIVTKAKKEEDSVYRMYYDFKEPVFKIASHRVLAVNRGEREGYLQVKIEVPDEKIMTDLKQKVVKKPPSPTSIYVEKAVEDAYKRLIYPSMENEIRNIITEKAEEQAIKVFKENLKNLLLQPPIKGKIVMGIDPAYRTGCKIAVVDETGKVLDTAVIYPTPPQNKVDEAKKIVKYLIDKYKVDLISIGNGTASRETEFFIADVLKEINKEDNKEDNNGNKAGSKTAGEKTSKKVQYVIVSEAGASVYSASKLAAEEFPDYDVSQRSAVSIARRLQDPLAELVKIDPKSIGVGQYQHDMNQKRLDESLKNVVEDCVNKVGVDVNTASPSLLSYVSGINASLVKNIVEYREQNGKFKSREELKKVKRMGEKTFEQCAGFLRVPDSDNVLDNTGVHPESYQAVLKLLDVLGYTLEDVKKRNLADIKKKIEEKRNENIAKIIGVGVPTLRDIIEELLKPGRDPRDEMPKPIFHTDVMKIEDIKPGMILMGTVRNVADFGAFVDIGVHQDGLVHISELSDKYVRNPMEVVTVGDIVKVRVIDVDVERKRISLSMKGV